MKIELHKLTVREMTEIISNRILWNTMICLPCQTYQPPHPLFKQLPQFFVADQYELCRR